MLSNKIFKIEIVLSLFVVLTGCNAQKDPTPEQLEVLQQAKANFVFVEGGTFTMGNAAVPGSTREHQVTLDAYSMSKYETTFKEYDIYTSLNKLDSIRPEWRHQDDMGPNYGVISVNWQKSKDYCLWLGQQLNLPIDLPTEAQWEYAARSRGLKVNHATDNGKIVGNYKIKRNYNGSKVEVGSYPPQSFRDLRYVWRAARMD